MEFHFVAVLIYYVAQHMQKLNKLNEELIKKC